MGDSPKSVTEAMEGDVSQARHARPGPVSPLAASLGANVRAEDQQVASDESPFEEVSSGALRYRGGPEVGRGGLGVVLRGWDTKLGRPVALKILPPELGGSEARFAREVRLTGRLQHPGIVPLYDAGKDSEGRAFYAMRLLPPGATLAERLAEIDNASDRMRFLPNVLSAIEAVAYAHAQGVVHRDLKPENILIGEFGETLVIDWGVAKDGVEPPDSGSSAPSSDQAAQLTMEGELVGSPAYMAPEQARGEPVDARADVFALGAILYRVLAGRPPYQGSSVEALLRVAEARFEDIDQVAPDAPRELKAMVRKATARVPAHRYPSAGELADDLRRYQAGQLVLAHQYTWWGLLWRWVRRHRAAVTVSALSVVLVAIAVAVAFSNVVSARKLAEAERAIAEDRSRAITLVQARTELDVDPTASIAWLKTYPVDAPDMSLARGLALEASDRGVALHSFAGVGGSLWFSSDGSRIFLLSASGDNRVLLGFDVSEGQWLQGSKTELTRVALLPKRDRLVAGTWSGAVEVYDRDLRKLSTVPVCDIGLVYVYAISDSKVAVVDESNRLFIVDIETGVTLPVPQTQCRMVMASDAGRGFCLNREGGVTTFDDRGRARAPGWHVSHKSNLRPGLAISAKGDSLAIGADDGSVYAGTFDGAHLVSLEPHQAAVTSVAFVGDLVIAAGRDGILSAHHAASGRLVWRKPFEAALDLVEVAPSGSWFVVLAQSGAIHLLTANGDEFATLRQRGAVTRAAISPDERFLATAGAGPMRVWSVPPRPTTFTRHRSDVESIAFLPDRGPLVSAGVDGEVRASEPLLRSRPLGKSPHSIKWLWPTSRGPFAVTNRSVALFPVDGGAAIERELAGPEPVSSALSRDGALWTVLDDGSVRRWDGRGEVSTAYTRAEALSEPSGGAIAASTTSNTVIFSAGDASVHLLSDGHEKLVKRDGSIPAFLALLPSDEAFVVAEKTGRVELWSTKSLERVHAMALPGSVRRAVLNPAGTEVAIGMSSGAIHLVALAAWVSRVLEGHDGPIHSLTYSPDGRWISSSGADKSVRVWSTASGDAAFVRRHSNIVLATAFSEDGATLAMGGWDQVAQAFPLHMTPISREGGALRQFLSTLTSARVVDKGEIQSAYPAFVTK